MANPYSDRADSAFWKRAVAGVPADAVDPVVSAPFVFGASDRIATAGSCFAQHIARTLVREGFTYLVTEEGPDAEQYGLFPARFGNIYSTLQLIQLFERAYGLFEPLDWLWTRGDGVVDPFRPLVETFADADALQLDRARHLAAVRQMFETCDAFVFTLGLTETWVAEADGAAVPLAPGVSRTATSADYKFQNRPVTDMVADLLGFIDRLRVVRPGVRIVLTVSPVPLVATFEPRHVLTSTTYSKSALRVVAEMVSGARPDVAYFPSYEIITGPHAKGRYYAPDLREVTPEGVAHVMRVFKRHYLSGSPASTGVGAALQPATAVAAATSTPSLGAIATAEQAEDDALFDVVCEEEAIADG